MIGFLSAYDENEKSADKKKIFFLHVIASIKDSVKKEVSPYALAFARQLNLKKVYLFYGKEKIVYEFDDDNAI